MDNDKSLIGQEIAGYLVEDLIGQGGMAAVYLALDPRLNRRVALKVLNPQLSMDQRFRQRFAMESQTIAGIDHPNIVPIFEAGAAGDILYIAMRYVDGVDLRMLLDRRERVPPGETNRILSQVAVALDTAHASDLIHRDVKPANILIADGDHVYLTDFGITRHRTSLQGLTATNQLFGTPRYMAPEQISKEEIDGRCDQYALACVAYEMLCGRPPFRRENDFALLRAHLDEAPAAVSAFVPGIPSQVDAVMGRAMAKNPDHRFASCGEFVTALRDAMSEPTGEVPMPGRRRDLSAPRPHQHSPAPLRRRFLVGVAAAVVLLTAVVLAALVLRGGGWEKYPGSPAAPVGFEHPGGWTAGAHADLFVVISPRQPEFARLFGVPVSADWTEANAIIRDDPEGAAGIYTGLHETLRVSGSGEDLQASLAAIMPGTLSITAPAARVRIAGRGAVRIRGTIGDPQGGGRLDFDGFVIDRQGKAAYIIYFCETSVCDEAVADRAARTAVLIG